MTTSLEKRFWSKVKKQPGCWEWLAAKHDYGYGVIGAGGRGTGILRAHRVSWVLHYGPIPEGMIVLHKCDNPECTNPDHLTLGTHADNVADKISKGRGSSARNGNHGFTKLTLEQVNQIPVLKNQGYSERQIANLFGVRRQTINDIVNQKTWKED